MRRLVISRRARTLYDTGIVWRAGSGSVARKANKSNVVAYPSKKPARAVEKPADTGVPRQDDAGVMALDLPPGTLSPAMQAYFKKCEEKLGVGPNVLLAYAFDNAKLEAFAAF